VNNGTELNHYRITAKLGTGGMGEVYRATDTKLGREIALKLLAGDVAADPERLARFQREARAIAALNHPGIVTIYSVEESNGRHFITMELVEGTTLETLIQPRGMPLSVFFELAIPIVDAVSTAHERGITHRDLKPTNIMVTREGTVKVLDFGVAKSIAGGTSADDVTGEIIDDDLTGEGKVVGTVAYMSPEQAEGEPVDHRSDIFSLGVVLYEMITGGRPFKGRTKLSILSSILRDEPPPVTELKPALPQHLGYLIGRCLAKSPSDRYPSSEGLSTDLRAVRRELDTSEVELRAVAPVASAVLATKVYEAPMVGREAERASLIEMLDKAASGQGSLVVIGGEPGIGKTRLAWDILEEARRRKMGAFIGHCYESEGAPPFIPWVEILEAAATVTPPVLFRQLMGDSAPELAKLLPELRRIYPDIPAPLDLPAEEARRYLFKSMHAYIERATRNTPSIMVLDDLHWAEDGTLLLLEYLAPRLAAVPLLVVGTYRDVELDVARPLAQVLQQLARERLAHRIALRRLPEAGVRRMLEALSGAEPPSGLVRVIHHETEGNPFFVEEVYQHLDEQGRLFDEKGAWKPDLSLEAFEVPEGVRFVVGRRLEQLGDEGRAILAVAATIGRRFSYALLQAIESVHGSALLDTIEEAERLQLIRCSGTASRDPHYTFSHELIRQTLLDGLSLPRLQRFHLQIAAAHEKAYARRIDELAPAMAHHLYQAGASADEEKLVHYLALAARQSLEAGAFEDAEEKLTLALSLLPPGAGAQRAAVLLRRGMALRSLSRMEEAVADWEQALPIFEELDEQGSIAMLCTECSYTLGWLGHGRQALAMTERGLEAVGDRASRERVRMLSYRTFALGLRGEMRLALEQFELAWAAARELGDEQMMARALMFRLYVEWHCLAAVKMVEVATEAAKLARRSGDDWALADILAFDAAGHLLMGHVPEAVRTAEEATTVARRVGNDGAELVAIACKLQTQWLRGRDWRPAFQEGRRKCEQSSLPWVSHFYDFAAMKEIYAGDLHAAQCWAGLAMDGEVRDVALTGVEWQAQILVHAFEGNRAKVLAMWEQQRHAVMAAPDPLTMGAGYRVRGAVEALALLGEYETAGSLYPLALRALEGGTVIQFDGNLLLHTSTGIAAAAAGEWDEADRLFATALDHAQRIPFRVGEADALRWHGTLLHDLGGAENADRARAMLEQALAIYRELGAPLHVGLVERTLAGA
jgi:tetratricopeptide (TPR) repeat protein